MAYKIDTKPKTVLKRTLLFGLLLITHFSYAQNIIKLRVEDSSNNADETTVYYNISATDAYENAFDAQKLFSTNPNVPSLYSYIPTHDLSINGKAPFIVADTVPISFKSLLNISYTIKGVFTNLDTNWTVLLEDTLLHIFHDLKVSDYVFTHNTSNVDERFFLHIGCVVSTPPIADICINDSSIILSGGFPEGGTYSGVGVSNDSIFTPSIAGAGTHNIIYTYNNNNCTSTDTQTVTVNALPAIFFNNSDSACINSGLLNLIASPSGGTFFGVGISGNTFDPKIAGIGTDTIGYTVTSIHGCTDTAYQTITVLGLPTINITSPDTFCINDAPFQMQATPSGGTFLFNGVPVPISAGNIIDPSALGLGGGILSYIHFAPNGCVDTVHQFLTVLDTPNVSAGANQLIVTGSNANLMGTVSSGTGPYSYAWSPSSLLVDSTLLNPQTLPINNTTVFTLTVTNSTTGCSNSSSVTITVTGGILNSTIPITIDTVICEGDSTQLNVLASGGSGSYTYAWSSGDTIQNPYVSPSSTQQYIITIDDGTTTIQDSITITVNPLPVVGLNPFSDTCLNEPPFLLTGGSPAGGIYSGTGVVNDTLFDPSIAGKGDHLITYTYTDSNGCSNDTSLILKVLQAPPVPTISQNGTQLNALPISGQADYQWFLNGSPLPNDTVPSITISQNGTYTVQITNGVGCSSISNDFTVNDISIAELNNLLPTIYPNPFNDRLIFTWQQTKSKNVTIALTDLSGRLIFAELIPSRVSTWEVATSSILPGVYLLQIQYSGAIHYQKLVKY